MIYVFYVLPCKSWHHNSAEGFALYGSLYQDITNPLSDVLTTLEVFMISIWTIFPLGLAVLAQDHYLLLMMLDGRFSLSYSVRQAMSLSVRE